MIYVTNFYNNTVSVVDGNKNKLIKDIPVGRGPLDIAVNPINNLVYVSNQYSNTISVINGTSNNLVAGITFHIYPTPSGAIYCNGKKVSDDDHVMYDLKTKIYCQAKPNDDFMFASWSGDLASSSSSAVLTVYKNGILTANFKQNAPIPVVNIVNKLPPELTGAIYAFIISSLIPTIVLWISSERQRKHLGKFMTLIEVSHKTLFHDKEEFLGHLEDLRRDIIELLKKRKLSESHYQILNDRISELIEKAGRQHD